MKEENYELLINFENVEIVVGQLLKDIYEQHSEIISLIANQNTFVSFVENCSYDSASSITILSNYFREVSSGALCTLVYNLYGIVDANDFDIDENIIMNPDQRPHFRAVAAEAMHQQARDLVVENPIQQVVIAHGSCAVDATITDLTQKVESMHLED